MDAVKLADHSPSRLIIEVPNHLAMTGTTTRRQSLLAAGSLLNVIQHPLQRLRSRNSATAAESPGYLHVNCARGLEQR
jgi:hypothetical protein